MSLERAVVGLGGGLEAPLSTPSSLRGLKRDPSESLLSSQQVGQRWPEVQGLAASVAEPEEVAALGHLHPRVHRDQGWGLLPKIWLWASGKPKPARSHLDPT